MQDSEYAKLATEAVLTDSNHVVVVADTSMTVLWASPTAKRYGIDPVGSSVVELIHPDDLERVASGIDAEQWLDVVGPSLLSNSIISFRVMTPEGVIPCDASGRWMRTEPDGEWLMVAVLREINTRAAVDEALRKMAAGGSGIEAFDAILEATRAFGGVSGAELLWHSADGRLHATGDLRSDPREVLELLGGIDLSTHEPRLLPQPIGDATWAISLGLASGDAVHGVLALWGTGPVPDLAFARGALEPVTDLAALAIEKTESHAELERRATTDLLTGLLNRHAFFTELEESRPSTAVMYVDLDAFKAVNDEHGHTVGDRLLSVVAKRLSDAVRESDVVSRIGGDEFAVLCRATSAPEARRVGERIVAALDQTFSIEGRLISSGASVGVAYSDEAHDGRVMLDKADQALLAAKAAGKGRAVIADVD